MGRTLFLIDFQNDFIDQGGAALPVKGALDDLFNVCDMLGEKGDYFDTVVVALDQHPFNHIAHAEQWVGPNNEHPNPFTTISYQDSQNGRWVASHEKDRRIQHEYLREVEEAGSSLTIWPQHCIIGSWGACLYRHLCWELKLWARPDRLVRFFPKSGNWSTEQYSSFKAIVPRFYDPSTLFNFRLYEAIKNDEIYIAGEALSHCVAQTVLDAIRHNPVDEMAQRMTLLINGTSPVTGCTVMAEEFLHEFTMSGGHVASTKEIIPVSYED